MARPEIGTLFRRGNLSARHAEVDGNRVVLLHDGREAFPAMLSAIADAQHEVLLEMYWFDSDATGQRFADALVACAQRGVDVCVVYDAVGSIGADAAMFDRMRAAGCDVREWNPVAPWRARFQVATINRRDHRKVLVVDNRIAITGGINIADLWAPVESGGDGWRDDAVLLEGNVAARLRDSFLDIWGRLEGRRPRLDTSALPAAPGTSDGVRVQVLANRARGDRRSIRRVYLEQIRKASKSIYICNSYFLPDRAIRKALMTAAQRGVDVRIILAGRSDVVAVYSATRRMYALLMSAGVRIFEWTKSVFHSKTAVVDGSWSTIGSYNLDTVSWRLNLELNVAISDRELGERMNERFFRDAAEAVAIDARAFSFRPMVERLLEWFFHLFRKFL